MVKEYSVDLYLYTKVINKHTKDLPCHQKAKHSGDTRIEYILYPRENVRFGLIINNEMQVQHLAEKRDAFLSY